MSLFFIVLNVGAQSVSLEGYVYEDGNRGYLNVTKVVAVEQGKIAPEAEAFTDVNGYFIMQLKPNVVYQLKYSKDFFKDAEQILTMKNGKTFTKMAMKREPGYMFEITLANKREDINTPTDAIKNTRVEVYNNTTKKSEMVIENQEDPHFRVHLNKGNHYTILVRKEGYFAKRMEANVAVHGCILCFEGVGQVRPGVTDNLTEGNENGVLLANVEMERLYEGKTVEVENLYYDLNQSYIREDAAKELDKVVKLMKYNPNIMVELGSHTDARGDASYNMDLSKARAKSAVEYLLDKGNVDSYRIQSKGYGELVLTNECADGVVCSEAKHQENRRTELKILGIDKSMVFKPLAEMKKVEEFEQMVVEGGAMGQSISSEEYQRMMEEEANTKVKVEEIRKAMNDETPQVDSGNTDSSQTNLVEEVLLEPEPAMEEPQPIIDVLDSDINSDIDSNDISTEYLQDSLAVTNHLSVSDSLGLDTESKIINEDKSLTKIDSSNMIDNKTIDTTSKINKESEANKPRSYYDKNGIQQVIVDEVVPTQNVYTPDTTSTAYALESDSLNVNQEYMPIESDNDTLAQLSVVDDSVSEEMEITDTQQLQPPVEIDPSLPNGVKIVLLAARERVPDNHEMYLDFDIKTYKAANGKTLYYFGQDGLTEEKADKMLNSQYLRIAYPNAFKIYFVNGVIQE